MSEEFERDATGVEDGDSQESTNSTTDAADAGQPNGTDRRIIEAGKTKQKINLDEYPEFRQVKSSYDKRIAQLERQYQQQLYQQQQELENKRLSEMDDYQRLEHRAAKAEQYAAYLEQQAQASAVERENRAIAERLSKISGAPVEDLLAQGDFQAALDYAEFYRQQSARRKAEEQAAAAAEKQRQRQDKQQRNAVDTGSGGGTPTGAWDTEYRKVRQQGNARDLFAFALDSSQRE